MSDVNFNATTVKALTTLEGLHGYVGGYIERLTYNPVVVASTTSATFVDITNMSNQTFTTPASGPHLLILSIDTYATTASVGGEFQMLIDDSTAVNMGQFWHNNSGLHDRYSFTAIVNLAAGQHTIRPQWKRYGGTGTMYCDTNSTWQATIQGQGSGINGLEVVESIMSSDHTITSTFPTWQQVDSVQVVVNTLENERIKLDFSTVGQLSANGNANVRLGYQVDSDAVVHTSTTGIQDSLTFLNAIEMHTFTAPLSAGQHTIKLMVAQTGSQVVLKTDSAYPLENTFRATRFKSFAVGAGTIVTEDTIPSDKTITAAFGVQEDTGLEITVNTIDGEDILCLVRSRAENLHTAENGFGLYYKLDGDADVQVYSSDILPSSTGADRQHVQIAFIISALTSGSHTVKIRGACGNPNGIRLESDLTKFEIIQHRGGLIPVQDESIEIVDKPSALDFQGAGVTVTQSGTKAVITIPGGAGSTNFLDLTDTPSSYTSQGNKLVAVNVGETALEFVDAPAGNFIGLTDTPSSFTGQGSKVVAVNVGETALEFIDAAAGNFLDLTDTPSSFSGQAGKIPRVNTAEDALEFYVPTRGALGGYMERFEFTGTSTTTSSVYTDITGMVDQTMDTPVSGPHTILLTGTKMYVSSTLATMRLAVNIDGTDYDVVDYGFNAASTFYDNPTGFIVIDLEAGSHTIRPRWKRISGSGILSIDLGPLYVQAIGHGTGINGLSVQDDGIVSDVDFTTPADWADTGLEITFDALNGEYVTLTFSGNATWISPASTLVNINIAYKLDSDSEVPVIVDNVGDPTAFTSLRHLEFARLIGPLTAGSHTIKIRGKADGSGTRTWRLYAANALAQVVRHLSAEAVQGEVVEIYAGNTMGSTLLNAQTTFVDVDSVDLNQTAFDVETGGDYLILFKTSAFGAGGNAQVRCKYRLIFDEGAGNEQIIDPGSGTGWTSRHDDQYDRQIVTQISKVALIPGSHTVTAQWAIVSGTGTDNIYTDGNDSWSLHLISAAPTASIGGSSGSGSSNFTGLIDTPSSYISQGNKLVAVNSAENALEFIDAPAGDFLGLTDTPSSFTDNAGKVPFVNDGETALEFRDIPALVEGAFPGVIATEDVLTSALNTTTSYQDVTSVTFDCIQDETVLMLFDCETDDNNSTTWGNHIFKVVVDDVDYPYSSRNQRFDTEYQYDINNVPIHVSLSLASGPHTVKVQVLRNGSATVGRVLNARETILQFRGSGINGLDIAEDTISSDYSIPVGSYGSTGHSCTINTFEGERVQISFVGRTSNVSGGFDPRFAYRIDGGSDIVIYGDYNETSPGDQTEAISFSLFTQPLSAGQHVIEFRAMCSSGSGVLKGASSLTDSRFQVARFKSYSIGAGSIVTAGSGVNTTSFTSLTPVTLDTVNITTAVDNEAVVLTFNGYAGRTAGNSGDVLICYYQIDSGSDIAVHVAKGVTSYDDRPITYAVPIIIPSAGPHAINLRFAISSVGSTWRIIGGQGTANTSYVIQYRGGLIPVQDDGLEIVDKPSALNFTGAGVTVTDVNGVATIAIPGGAGSTNFLALTDTPASYSGQGNKLVSVNVGETALEFIDAPAGDFIGLTDTPSSYTGEAGKIVRVNDAEDGVEFVIPPDGTLGGYIEQLSFNTSGHNSTSATYEDLTGMVDQTITTPVSGKHLFSLETYAYGLTAQVVAQYALNIDGIDYALRAQTCETVVALEYRTHYLTLDLSAGDHTIRPRVKRLSGTGTVRSPGGTFSLVIQAQGSGINGLEVVEEILSGNILINTISPSWQATGLIATFNTLENEQVRISYIGNAQSVESGTAYIGYRIDGGTPQCAAFHTMSGVWNMSMNFSVMSPALSAGQHTVEIMGKMFASGDTWNLLGASTGTSQSALQVTRFKSFGIGAGTIVTEDYLTSTWTQTNSSVFEDTPLEITINTIEDEQVILNTAGTIIGAASGNLGYQLQYVIDGTPTGPQHYEYVYGTGVAIRVPISSTYVTAPLTAGPHTIKVQAYKNGVVNNTWQNGTRLQAVQHRGGLIPILDDTVEIVDKPSALDFQGAGVTVTQSGTKAVITIPGGGGGGGGSGRREVWQIEDGDVPPITSRIGSSLGFATARKFDPDTNNDVIFQSPVPDNRASGSDITVVLKYVMETDNSGDVKLDLDYVVSDIGEDVDPASADANLTSTFTPGSGAELHRSTTFTIVSANIPSNNAMIFARLTRDAVDAADTHTGEWQLTAIELSYTTT